MRAASQKSVVTPLLLQKKLDAVLTICYNNLTSIYNNIINYKTRKEANYIMSGKEWFDMEIEELKEAIHERIEAERHMTRHGNKLYHMQSRLKMLEHQKNAQKTQ